MNTVFIFWQIHICLFRFWLVIQYKNADKIWLKFLLLLSLLAFSSSIFESCIFSAFSWFHHSFFFHFHNFVLFRWTKSMQKSLSFTILYMYNISSQWLHIILSSLHFVTLCNPAKKIKDSNAFLFLNIFSVDKYL